MDIGNKLKEKRAAANLSQEDLAKVVGVSRQTVSSWENSRSYPDIGSLLKLSDLYGVSLDELLKEDPLMKKHVEDTAPLPRKYWNLLFEMAILLIPIGSLVGHWGAPWLGLILRLMGAVMLPPLWVARWKLFGMPRDEMKRALIGWGLWLGGSVFSIFTPIGSLISLLGLLMIIHNGVYLERGTRFWLIIFLCIGIPIYILFSGMTSNLDDRGAFSQAQPFGYDYHIVETEFGEEPDPIPTLELSMLGNSLILDGETLGNFTYIEPREDQSAKGIWQLVPEHEPQGLYRLEVCAENETTLAYFVDDQLQWRWQITPVPTAQFLTRYLGTTTIAPIDWYPPGAWPQDPEELEHLTLIEGESISILLGGTGPETLTVTEEYHWGDTVETTQIPLQKNRANAYPFPDKFTKRYENKEQYVVYSFQWEGGIFIMRLNFE